MSANRHALSTPDAPESWRARVRRILGGRRPPPGASGSPEPFSEARWPILLTIVGAVLLYGSLPERLTFGPTWAAPAIEGALLLPLVLTEPGWRTTGWHWQRVASLLLVGVIQVSNLISLVLLVDALLHGSKSTGQAVIGEAVKIWLTNVLVFGLWYWELDRGGPRARYGPAPHAPDFLFPQMGSPAVAPADWMPTLVDYLYVALTNAMAFSPTDTLPLTRRAKALMGIQSLISLLTIALVAARAVNILS